MFAGWKWHPVLRKLLSHQEWKGLHSSCILLLQQLMIFTIAWVYNRTKEITRPLAVVKRNGVFICKLNLWYLLRFQARDGDVYCCSSYIMLLKPMFTSKWIRCCVFVPLRIKHTRQALYNWATFLTWILWGFHFWFSKTGLVGCVASEFRFKRPLYFCLPIQQKLCFFQKLVLKGKAVQYDPYSIDKKASFDNISSAESQIRILRIGDSGEQVIP